MRPKAQRQTDFARLEELGAEQARLKEALGDVNVEMNRLAKLVELDCFEEQI